MPPDNKKPAAQYQTWFVYLLWAVGGFLGLHHVYLGRNYHAFLWWATCGGFFGIGWVRDMWRIPDYVAEANGSAPYTEKLIRQMKMSDKPPLCLSRFAAEFFFGLFAAVATIAGVPSEWIEGNSGILVQCILVPLTTALAVYMVCNIGHQKASLQWALLGAYLTVPLYIANTEAPGSNLSHCALAATIAINWKGKTWRKSKPSKHSRRRQRVVLLFCAALYALLWFSALFNNAYVTTHDGVKVRLRDSLGNIRESQACKEPWETFKAMLGTFEANGFHKMWREFVNAMDPEGEMNSYEVLGISPGATEADIRRAYRKQAMRFHPDSSTSDKELFLAVQKAYDTLSAVRSRRTNANRKNREKDTHRPL